MCSRLPGLGTGASFFNAQPHRCPLLTLNDHLDERGDADDVNPIQLQITTGDSHGLDRLVDRASTDSLHIYLLLLSHDTCNGTRHRRLARGGRNPDDVHRIPPCTALALTPLKTHVPDSPGFLLLRFSTIIHQNKPSCKWTRCPTRRPSRRTVPGPPVHIVPFHIPVSPRLAGLWRPTPSWLCASSAPACAWPRDPGCCPAGR